MSIADNKRVVRRIFEDDLSEADPDVRARVAAEIFAADFYDPTNPPGMQHGLAGHAAIVNLFRCAFPDMRWTIDGMLGEEHQVVVRTTMTGSHQGEFFGIPATGRQVCVGGIHILTLHEGKIILHEGINDDMGMMRQLGVVPG